MLSRCNCNPHCGDDTALLYFANNYFCCANGTTAYENEQGYVGCTTDVNAVLSNSDLTTLKSISTASQTTTASSSSSTAPATTTTSATSFSTTTSSSPTASSTSEPASSRGDSSSSTNTGAIAGGVVGGVAGAALLLVLAWFLYRHRNKKNYDSPENTPALAPVRQVGGTGELEGSEVTNPSELANYGWYGHKDPCTSYRTARAF
ncbi:hypothetical protein N7470_003416 [Penicillium chermesinum]|nr:hypothetical protein N7470_003416 [Penicillium chermesinum]